MTAVLRYDDLPSRRSGPHLQVDSAALAANTRLFATRAGSAAVMAVVKADGFGHGAADLARTALANGATWLGVASLDEALALRTSGIVAPILSWLNPVDADFAAACRHRIDVTIPSAEHLDAVTWAAAATGHRARVHLQLDTGMARDGASPREWDRLCARARVFEVGQRIDVVGVMGHLACADQANTEANSAGLAAFQRGVALARRTGLRPPLRHLATTAATLTDPRTHFDLVRIGAGLVGIDPSGTTELSGALTVTAPVVSVRRVTAGTGVGYGHTHVTDRSTYLGLIPLGYADGVPRIASGHAEVSVGGRRRPLAGLVSMDQIVVDLGDRPVPLGEVATILGPGDDGEPTIAEWAGWAGTIGHEIVTGFGSRLSRTFGSPPGHDDGSRSRLTVASAPRELQ